MTDKKRVIVGISGASGAIYGINLLKALKSLNIETHLIVSPDAEGTIETETPYKVNDLRRLATVQYDYHDVGASIASGSYFTSGMVIAPCSIKTLSAVANSYNENLLIRAADVCLKERRRLVLMVRETPLHLGHLKLMTAVTEIGATILPPVPAFYHMPKTIDDIVNQTVGKALDQLDIDNIMFNRWEGTNRQALNL